MSESKRDFWDNTMPMPPPFSLLLCTPPMVQINTPYPATAYLSGFFRSRYKENDLKVHQTDPAIELICRLFSRTGLRRIKKAIALQKPHPSPSVKFFLEAYDDYEKSVEPVLEYLQGKRRELTEVLAANDFVPEGPRFLPLREHEQLQEKYAELPLEEQAKHIASLFLDDLADVVRDGVDAHFEFARYGERLAASQISFTPLLEELEKRPTLVDTILEEITTDTLKRFQPDLLCLSVPFSGTVYGAFRMARTAKKLFPNLKIVLGGGYVNTELRELSDPRVFDFFDFITLDDGERPLECLLEFLRGSREEKDLFRTYLRKDGKVLWHSSAKEHDIPFRDTGTPSYSDLPLEKYAAMFETLNPVQRLWSGYRWNKLTLAHGCYWRKCSFCDTTLDYIGRYENSPIDILIQRMQSITKETGVSGFHFVDEAAPPAALAQLSQRLIERNIKMHWWGNIRFEKTFTKELTKQMAKAGCIAVTGGLEVASPRILELINKGVTIEQVARVTKAFQDAGIFVHAYLMYGFPTQTTQETVDSLEVVRQLFANQCLHSGFWHRFAATVHSPIGKNPEKYGIRLAPAPIPKEGIFAKNDVPFIDPTPCDHDAMGKSLRAAVYNYMHGIGIDADVRDWFSFPVPKTKVSATLIQRALHE